MKGSQCESSNHVGKLLHDFQFSFVYFGKRKIQRKTNTNENTSFLYLKKCLKYLQLKQEMSKKINFQF